MSAKERNGRIVALGGTFDLLHKGHKKIISKALQVGDRVIIGLASHRFVEERRKDHIVSNYESRRANLESFLAAAGELERVEIVPLDDPYGPSVTDREISAMVVSRETLETALEINKVRFSRGMAPIQVYVVDFAVAEDGKPVSTSGIRQGLMNKEGKLLGKGPTGF
jgi:pantetheine-phosphate adenylyltransferase